MKYFVFVPETIVVGAAVAVLIAGRMGWLSPVMRRYLAAACAIVVLVALGIELWAGAAVTTYFGGALVQDRFALFAKAAALLAAAAAIATADWTAEDASSIAVTMPMLAAFGVMVAASAGDLVGLWAGLELAGAAGVVVVAQRRPEVALRVLIAGGVATALMLSGFVYLYASTGTADLSTMRTYLLYTVPTLPLVLPVLLMMGGLAFRAGLSPFQLAELPAGLRASPLGAGLVLGLVALGAGIAAIKIATALIGDPDLYSPYLSVLAAAAMAGGGAMALAVRSPRARIAFLATSQMGWVAAGLVGHNRAGVAASLFLLGAFGLAATCGPAVLGRADGGELAIAGLASLRPARAAGLALAILSLAGAPPLAGFFGELAVAASLAQAGQWILIAVGVVSSILCLAAAIGTLRVLYIQNPLEEARRSAALALPAVTGLSSASALLFCVFIAAYGFAGNPIMSLADQGAEALGLR